MLKNKIILSLVAVVLVVILFNLPKAIVGNTKKSISEEASPSPDTKELTSSTDNSPHTAVIPESEENKITFLREKYYNSIDKEKSAKFADSLGNAFKKHNMYDSAVKYFELAAVRAPGEKTYEIAGDAYYEAFNFSMNNEKSLKYGDKAREFYNKILNKDANRLDVKNKVAMTYLSTSNPMQGIMMLREIIEEDPKNQEALYNLGILSYQSGQYKKAADRFETLIKLYPDNLQAHFYLGASYFELNNQGKAKEQFELVKKLDTDPEVQATADEYLKKINK